MDANQPDTPAWHRLGLMPLSWWPGQCLVEVSLHDWDIRAATDPEAVVAPVALPGSSRSDARPDAALFQAEVAAGTRRRGPRLAGREAPSAWLGRLGKLAPSKSSTTASTSLTPRSRPTQAATPWSRPPAARSTGSPAAAAGRSVAIRYWLTALPTPSPATDRRVPAVRRQISANNRRAFGALPRADAKQLHTDRQPLRYKEARTSGWTARPESRTDAVATLELGGMARGRIAATPVSSSGPSWPIQPATPIWQVAVNRARPGASTTGRSGSAPAFSPSSRSD